MNALATASRSRSLFGGVACIGLTALLVVFGAGQIREREAGGSSEFTLEVPDASTIAPETAEDDIPMLIAPDANGAGGAPDQSATELPETGTDRSSNTGGAANMTSGTPTSPLDEPAAITPPSEPIALARPIVIAAGRFNIAGKVLELDGIVPVAVNRQCTDTSGEGWPCGRMARTAFANLVRGRTIDCDVPSTEWSGTAKARCTLAGKDLAQWLVENGWAEAEDGSPLFPAAEAARQAGVGLHSPDPRRSKLRSQDNSEETPAEAEQQQP